MKQFGWTKQLLANIAARKAVVNVRTLEDFYTFLQMLDENGYSLITIDYISWGRANIWNIYKSETCLRFGNSDHENGYCDVQYFKVRGYEIIKFDSTFKFNPCVKYLL